MSRDRTRTRDGKATDEGFAAEFEIGDVEADDSTGADSDPGDAGLRDRLARRSRRVFSPRSFLAALVLTGGALFAASAFVPLPGVGLLGVFVATFLLGLVFEERRYAETALAGGIVAASSTLLDFAVVAFLGGFGVSLALLTGSLGAVAGGLGTYFGRDLRDGLTRDID